MKDKLLVNRHNRSNRDVLRSIYEEYRDSLLVLAVALSNDLNTAEDAVHDVFVAFAGTLDDFKLTGSLKAYLTKCVANRVRDLMRAKRNRAKVLDPGQNYPESPHEAEPVGLIICNEQLQILCSAMAQLPYEQREVIVLRIHGQMRFAALAKFMGLSVNTVKGRYRYGIKKLRSILNSEI
jgi:RNA polymerase sigma-70 factor (ECF subfamily)